jgi:hypothetical protein
MKRIALVLLAIVALVTACVPSLYPFYTDKDVVTDVRLVGTWRTDNGNDNDAEGETWKFEASTNKTYTTTIIEAKEKIGHFECHLFKIRQDLFIDMTPSEIKLATDQADIIGASIIPGHLLFRVKFEGQKLKIAGCNFSWIEQYIKKHPSAIRCRLYNDSICITDETIALQKFVSKHLNEGEMFNNWQNYKRL